MQRNRDDRRTTRVAFLVAALLLWPDMVRSQETLPTLTKVQVGFTPLGASDSSQGAFKPFFWTPVWIELRGGASPVRGDVVLETLDADGVGVVTKVPFAVDAEATARVLGYAKTSLGAQRSQPVSVSLHVDGHVIRPPSPLPERGVAPGKRLCVIVGTRIPALEQLLARARDEKDSRADQTLREFQSWQLASVDSTDAMPDRGYGYDAADVVIVQTQGLTSKQYRPLDDWVQCGGRLIVLLTGNDQSNEHAAPLPHGAPVQLTRLADSADNSVQEWGLSSLFPDTITVARVPQPDLSHDDWVRYAAAKSAKPIPLIARFAHGFGSITYVGLPLEKIPLAAENSPRVEAAPFFRMLLSRVAGAAPRPDSSEEGKHRPYVVQLHDQLDRFDVESFSFSWVAVLILLFMAIVGPLEFYVLRRVARPALTWITYPTVIAGMCLFAYLAAPRFKGDRLRINQIDLVDVDLTRRDTSRGVPGSLHVGRSYFTVFTPKSLSLDVGVEIADVSRGERRGQAKTFSHIVSWMGRADADYRVATAGLFRQPYAASADGDGLARVNMSVWGTKNFCAQWHANLSDPLEHALSFPGRKAEDSGVRVRGMLTNRLPVDLCDVWVLYDRLAFPLREGLPSGTPVNLELGLGRGTQGIAAWMESPDREADTAVAGEQPEATLLLKAIMFRELSQTPGDAANLFRTLDWSWRIRPAAASAERAPREAIIVARAKSARGPIDDAYSRQPSQTRVRLRPANGAAEFGDGQLTHAQYFRILVPVISEDP
jgi:hypothetical protein